MNGGKCYAQNGIKPLQIQRVGFQQMLCTMDYCLLSKTSKSEKGKDNSHPTVKPLKLMRYLCRLITPKGGTVLDPFMGSGSTGMYCKGRRV